MCVSITVAGNGAQADKEAEADEEDEDPYAPKQIYGSPVVFECDKEADGASSLKEITCNGNYAKFLGEFMAGLWETCVDCYSNTGRSGDALYSSGQALDKEGDGDSDADGKDDDCDEDGDAGECETSDDDADEDGNREIERRKERLSKKHKLLKKPIDRADKKVKPIDRIESMMDGIGNVGCDFSVASLSISRKSRYNPWMDHRPSRTALKHLILTEHSVWK